MTPPRLTQIARTLRKRDTWAEKLMWSWLRDQRFSSYKFRRQHPLDRYILDFYCPTAKLAIELDGGGHNYRVGQVRDRTRSEFLSRKELDSVLQAIWFALQERCSSKPSL